MGTMKNHIKKKNCLMYTNNKKKNVLFHVRFELSNDRFRFQHAFAGRKKSKIKND